MICTNCHESVPEANYCEQCGEHLPKMIYPHYVPEQFVNAASLHHDGQTSAMYSVSSTGYIHDRDYRSLLEAELIRAIKMGGRVKSFLAWVESLPEDPEDV